MVKLERADFLKSKMTYHNQVANTDKERGVMMTIEEILSGESKNVEFKENLSEKSITKS